MEEDQLHALILEQNAQIAEFLESEGRLQDCAPLMSDPLLAHRLFAKYGFVPETYAIQKAGGPGVNQLERPACGMGNCAGIMTAEKHDSEWRWRCNSRSSGSKCKNVKSVLHQDHMMFESKIEYHHLFSILYCMVLNLGYSTIKRMTGLYGDVVTPYTTYVKEMMTRFVLINYDTPNGKIGGPGMIVEIDETKIAKRKSNTGQL